MTQMKKTNRKFSPEFKLEAIEQVISHHQHVVDIRRLKLRSRLRELHAESRGSAGSRMLSELLRQENLNEGRWLARRLMKECDLVSYQPGEHRYRVCKEENAASSNLLRRAFSPSVPNQTWCGDISYLCIRGGWCYLAVVMELNSRRVVGSAISGSPDAELVCKAMRNALESRHIRGRLVFHSDQGSQYSSKKFRQFLWRNSVIQTMSRRGNCWDNAPMDRA